MTRAWLAALVTLVLAATGMARAQGVYELRIIYPFGEPSPAMVGTCLLAEASNRSDREVRVRVELVAEAPTGAPGRGTIPRFVTDDDGPLAWAEAALPAHSTRRLLLQIHSPYRGLLYVERLMAHMVVDGEVVGRCLVRQKISGSGLVVVLSPRPGLAFSLPALLQTAYNGNVVRPGKPGSLPETWNGYQACQMVVLHDRLGLNLSVKEMEGLADWVRMGGHLVVLSSQNPEEYRNTPLEPLLPLRPQRLVEVDGVNFLVGPPSTPHPLVQATRHGFPLLLTATRGWGEVTLIATEMIRPELMGEKTTRAVWDKVLNHGAVPGRIPDSREFSWDELPAGPLKFTTLCMWLGLYFLAAGPLNFWLLRRRERRIWVLVTLPILSIAFALAMLGLQWHRRGLDARLSQGGVLYLSSGETNGVYEGQVSLYSVWEGSYTLQVGRDYTLFPSGGSYYFHGADDIGLGWGPGGPVCEVRNAEVNAWSGTGYQPRGPVHLGGPVRASASLCEDRFVGQIENQSELTLRDCRVVNWDRYSPTFDLPPGRTLKLDLEASQGNPGAEQLDPAARQARSTLLSVVHRPPKQATWLVGWLDRSPEPVRLTQRSLRSDTTLVLVVAQP